MRLGEPVASHLLLHRFDKSLKDDFKSSPMVLKYMPNIARFD